jgi:flagellar hook assembly protein FlgD
MVRLKVYDVRGRLVRTVVSESLPVGNHTTVWNGVDQHGRQVASGVYFARFEAGSTVQVQRMVLLR